MGNPGTEGHTILLGIVRLIAWRKICLKVHHEALTLAEERIEDQEIEDKIMLAEEKSA